MVFELDEHPLSRPQGDSLDIHADSVQHALREAGREAAFKAPARYDDQYDAIYDSQGTLRFEHRDTGDADRPEIDRTQLRSLLLGSLPKETSDEEHMFVRAAEAAAGAMQGLCFISEDGMGWPTCSNISAPSPTRAGRAGDETPGARPRTCSRPGPPRRPAMPPRRRR